jgi:hypothetical protein
MNPESDSDEKWRLTLHCTALDLTVEFFLKPGEFGRIGSSPEMEIALPIEGLKPEECRFSRDDDGVLWFAPGGSGEPVKSPDRFQAGPWQFTVTLPLRARLAAVAPPVVRHPPPLPVAALAPAGEPVPVSPHAPPPAPHLPAADSEKHPAVKPWKWMSLLVLTLTLPAIIR